MIGINRIKPIGKEYLPNKEKNNNKQKKDRASNDTKMSFQNIFELALAQKK